MLSIIKLRMLGLRDEYIIFIIMTVMALGLTYVFGSSMETYRPTVLIVDEDQSKYSIMIQEELKNFNEYKYVMSSYENAIKDVDEGNAITALVIEKGFEEEIKKGKKPTIGIIKIKDDMDILVLENIVSSTTLKILGNIKIANITTDYISKNKAITDNMFDRVYNKIISAWKYNKPIEVSGQLINIEGNNEFDNLKHYAIGFSIFFSMYTMVFGIGTILNDRQYNTWHRMLVSPVSEASILGGSLIAAYFMGAIQLAVLILAGKYLFNIDWGRSIAGILTIGGSFVFAVTCLGLFLSGIVKTHAQLASITPVILTSTAMIGGCMWPLEIVNSKVLLFLANFTPQKWAVMGMGRIAIYGEGFKAAIMPSIILLVMGIVFFAAGVKLVKIE